LRGRIQEGERGKKKPSPTLILPLQRRGEEKGGGGDIHFDF